MRKDFAAGLFSVKKPARSVAIEFLIDLMDLAVPSLEEGRNKLTDASEDAITEVLCANLSLYTTLTKQTNSGGHVDFYLKSPVTGISMIVGEAKKHCSKSYSWYQEGVIKLVYKFTSTKTICGVLVYYYNESNLKQTMDSWKTKIEQGQLAGYTKTTKLSAIDAALMVEHEECVWVTHHLSNGFTVPIVHVWINLCSENDEVVVKQARTEANKKLISRTKKPQ